MLSRPALPTYAGVLVRANPEQPDRDHYAAFVGPDGMIGLARRDGYLYSSLGTGPALASGLHRLTAAASGFEPVLLVVRLDGVEVLRVSDASPAARPDGQAGLFDYLGGQHPMDDFTVGRGGQ
jgi:hypothetical protein